MIKQKTYKLNKNTKIMKTNQNNTKIIKNNRNNTKIMKRYFIIKTFSTMD